MLALIRSRGPDGEGEWLATAGGWHLALGHRRLAIIDREHGGQPMAGSHSDSRIVYNGEVYDFGALRARLELAGHRFATGSDTEVVLQHLEEHGVAGLSDFNGMFALAAWDGRARRLLLARDRIGIKPLYWAPLPDGGLVFGSELSVVAAHPALRLRIDPEGLSSYFFAGYAHAPHTLLDGLHKLEPGHYLVWEDGRLQQPQSYWRLQDAMVPELARADEQELVDELGRRLQASVERHLVSDVPLGVLLSGGVDSSTVAVAAQKLSAAPLETFCIGFEEASFDERRHAALVAKQIGTRHRQEQVSGQGLLALVGPALERLDEPFADPSYLPTYRLAALAAGHVKVALSGDGGDELWGGYPTYWAHRAARAYAPLANGALGRFLKGAALALPVSSRYQDLAWKLRRFVLHWDRDPRRRHLRWMSLLDLEELGRAVPGGALPALLDEVPLRSRDALNDLMALDLGSYLPGSILTKVDRAAMAHGLEVRPVMLDNSLVEMAFSVGSAWKLRGLTSKYLLKRAVRRQLPPSIVHRRKHGLAVPLASWLNGPLAPLVRQALGSSLLCDAQFLCRDSFARLFDEHRRGSADWSRPLWALLVLQGWAARRSVAL